jgi:hypothetical protein
VGSYWGNSMIKRRISTNISQKHWELLQQGVEKFGTQEKVLELALENLVNSSKQSKIALTQEDKAWMHLKKEKTVCVIDKNAFKLIIENSNIEPLYDYFLKNKLIESRIELIFQKPIKELNLEELVTGIVSAGKLINWIDTVDYIENDMHYSLVMSHSLVPEITRMMSDSYRNMFKTYGVKAEVKDSTKNIFINVFKV